jgi:hypothetical protein
VLARLAALRWRSAPEVRDARRLVTESTSPREPGYGHQERLRADPRALRMLQIGAAELMSGKLGRTTAAGTSKVA